MPPVFVTSQAGEGWRAMPLRCDDGGFTGGNMDRPPMQRLLADIRAGKIGCVIVYKVDRLNRSLLDFSRLIETFEKHKVSFVSVTQQFNRANSMGRLVLNVLLSFAQFERGIIGERIRDKIAATKRKGTWAGGSRSSAWRPDPAFALAVAHSSLWLPRSISGQRFGATRGDQFPDCSAKRDRS